VQVTAELVAERVGEGGGEPFLEHALGEVVRHGEQDGVVDQAD
jgi:hypothetical protein